MVVLFMKANMQSKPRELTIPDDAWLFIESMRSFELVEAVCVGVIDSVATGPRLVDLDVFVDCTDQCIMLARVFQSQDISRY